MISRIIRVSVVVVGLILLTPLMAHAQMTSPNYQIDEIFVGSGGELEACSTTYCSQQSAGGTGGDTSSSNYSMQSGFGSPDEPSLSLVVSNNVIDLGILSESSTSAASANFSVSNYLSNGYIVRVHGSPPTNSGGTNSKILTPLNSPNPSQPGAEQFGINLVSNSNPGIGVNPVQQPDGSFSYGKPSVGYDQSDYFKYQDGDIIAESSEESGQTDYTMSIIANISTSTAGGRYTTTLVVQAIATF